MPVTKPRWKGDTEPVPAYRDAELGAFSKAIREAAAMWKADLAATGGDRGTCVMGAGLAVYHLPPRARVPREKVILHPPGQSDCSWCIERARKHLEAAGLQGLHFEYGRMD